jgi:hypothetical protein
MKTYIADIIPKIKMYSQRLDDLTKLTNQHWVSIGDIRTSKIVYIFDKSGEIDIFENGLGIDSGTWKFIDQHSIKLKLTNSPTLLLRHGFFDENVIALKLDSIEGYAFFVNENKYQGELNSIEDILKFLEDKYLNKSQPNKGPVGQKPQGESLSNDTSATYKTEEGMLTLTGEYISKNKRIIRATLDGLPAPDGRYKLDFMWYVTIKDGVVI